MPLEGPVSGGLTPVTVPCGCAVQLTSPVEVVVSADVPLQFFAAPTITTLVPVAVPKEKFLKNGVVVAASLADAVLEFEIRKAGKLALP